MEINQEFWEAFKNNRTILMINQYHGVPITCQGTICMIGPDSLALSAHHRQLARIKHERHTYLECLSSYALIRGVPIGIDMKDRIVVLSNLTLMDPAVAQRLRELHIRPEEAVEVKLQLANHSIPARLVELIYGREGPVYLRVAVENHLEFHMKEMVGLALSLPPSGKGINLKGEVVRLNYSKEAAMGYVRIQAVADDPVAGHIKDYIHRREKDIEAEISENFQI